MIGWRQQNISSFVRRKYLFTDDHTHKSFILAEDFRGRWCKWHPGDGEEYGESSGNSFMTSKQICGPLAVTQEDRWPVNVVLSVLAPAQYLHHTWQVIISWHSPLPEWWDPSSPARLSRSRTDQNTPGAAPDLSASSGRPQTASRGRSLSWGCSDRWTRPAKWRH